MARALLPAAQVLLRAIGIQPGERVVDLACGTGNAAILAAGTGAQVVGVDREPCLLRIAAQRAGDAGLAVKWVEADAGSSGLPESSFDVVLSTFGVIYLADRPAAARALAGLCRPGGVIGLTAWAPEGFITSMARTLAPYLGPADAAAPDPAPWGDDRRLAGMLAAQGIHCLQSARRVLSLSFDNVQTARDFFLDTSGHVMARRTRLEAEGRWKDLLADMYALVSECNCAQGNDVQLSLDYLVSVAQKPFEN